MWSSENLKLSLTLLIAAIALVKSCSIMQPSETYIKNLSLFSSDDEILIWLKSPGSDELKSCQIYNFDTDEMESLSLSKCNSKVESLTTWSSPTTQFVNITSITENENGYAKLTLNNLLNITTNITLNEVEQGFKYFSYNNINSTYFFTNSTLMKITFPSSCDFSTLACDYAVFYQYNYYSNNDLSTFYHDSQTYTDLNDFASPALVYNDLNIIRFIKAEEQSSCNDYSLYYFYTNYNLSSITVLEYNLTMIYSLPYIDVAHSRILIPTYYDIQYCDIDQSDIGINHCHVVAINGARFWNIPYYIMGIIMIAKYLY